MGRLSKMERKYTQKYNNFLLLYSAEWFKSKSKQPVHFAINLVRGFVIKYFKL